ncbi:hypothetical protein INR49_004720 [Caranx melampygus]|nr:hypothetical protein INR49_004720 [Caranx melampygus]
MGRRKRPSQWGAGRERREEKTWMDEIKEKVFRDCSLREQQDIQRRDWTETETEVDLFSHRSVSHTEVCWTHCDVEFFWVTFPREVEDGGDHLSGLNGVADNTLIDSSALLENK